jgi:hypothetical protein
MLGYTLKTRITMSSESVCLHAFIHTCIRTDRLHRKVPESIIHTYILIHTANPLYIHPLSSKAVQGKTKTSKKVKWTTPYSSQKRARSTTITISGQNADRYLLPTKGRAPHEWCKLFLYSATHPRSRRPLLDVLLIDWIKLQLNECLKCKMPPATV